MHFLLSNINLKAQKSQISSWLIESSTFFIFSIPKKKTDAFISESRFKEKTMELANGKNLITSENENLLVDIHP